MGHIVSALLRLISLFSVIRYRILPECCCSEDRIRNGAKKLEKSRTTVTQGRLDNFFQVVSVTSSKRKVLSLDFVCLCKSFCDVFPVNNNNYKNFVNNN